jgi:hypothetical protein
LLVLLISDLVLGDHYLQSFNELLPTASPSVFQDDIVLFPSSGLFIIGDQLFGIIDNFSADKIVS